MSRAINTERACWAAGALRTFQDTVGERDSETAIADLIADLGHLAHKRKHDTMAVLRRGIRAWAYEQREPNGLGKSPSVSIRIGTPRTKRRSKPRAGKKGGAA